MRTTKKSNKILSLPKTLEEAIDYYIPRFIGMEHYFDEMNEDVFASFCHSQISGGIGMKIRNEMGFWAKNTDIYDHMRNVHNLKHPDEMSNLIIKGVYKKMKNI